MPEGTSVADGSHGPVAMCSGRRVFGVTGNAGQGKTSLVEDVIAQLILEGLSVSAIKHAHDGFDMDIPGKDSYRMRDAGCSEVMLVGDARWALMREYRNRPEPELEALVARMAPVDIVIVEGFRNSSIPKIEVFRPALGREPRWPGNPTIVAVATDAAVKASIPVLDLNDSAGVAAFIRRYVDP